MRNSQAARRHHARKLGLGIVGHHPALVAERVHALGRDARLAKVQDRGVVRFPYGPELLFALEHLEQRLVRRARAAPVAVKQPAQPRADNLRHVPCELLSASHADDALEGVGQPADARRHVDREAGV